jgi:hypothetical protein
MSAKPAILFFPCARPGSLPPAYDLDPEDSGAIVGGVELALALHISASAADLVAHYARQERADALDEAYFDAAESRRRADEWLTCHEEATTAAGQIFLLRLN